MTTRNVRPFVHLRVLSSYSLGLGLSSPGDVCRHARRVGFDTVALTDVSGTYGFVELHRAAREAGVKPIYGTLVFLDWNLPGHATEPLQSLIVLALDRQGLHNVCAVASESAVRRERREGFHAAQLDGLTDGVIAITSVDPESSGLDAQHLLGPLHDLFGERLFLECRADLPEEHRAVQKDAIAAATGLGISCVLTQDVRFVGPARPQIFDLMATLDESGFEHRVFSDRRAGVSTPDHGMATASEISNAYDEFPEAFTNASLIASLVQPDLFQALEEPPSTTPGDMFTVVRSGPSLRTRIQALNAQSTADVTAAERALASERVEHELALIDDAGVEPMLTRFERLVGLLRETGSRLGPATGLSVQSRCAFLLGVTSFDPYAIDPRFEPSFRPGERWGSVFDLQVSPDDRPAVLAIVNRAFAGASVGYVPSVEHLTAARSMRIVAKWLGMPLEEIDDAIQAATRSHGATLRQLAEENRAFAALYRRSTPFRELVAHAASVEGLPFGFARTKRTVIVSPRPLRDFFAHTVSPTTGDHFVQATRDSFPLGAVLRIDLALLRVLSVLPDDVASSMNHAGEAYTLIEKNDLEGIHLLDGAQGRLAASFGIRSFEDLVHFVALLRWRESGMSLIQRLSAFREGAHAVPAATQVGDVLAPTGGLLLFRDQLRDVAAALTGWDRAEASLFLSRLDDRTPGNLAAMRQAFFNRTVEQSVSLEDAAEWFARLVHEAARAIDRQRVIADCLLTERCLEMKFSRRDEFLRRIAETSDEKRPRYETPGRRAAGPSPAAPVVPELSVANEPAGPEEAPGREVANSSPAQTDLLGDLTANNDPPGKIISSRNPGKGFVVLSTVSELYPHPTSTPVQLAGRIRNLLTFRSRTSKRVGYFELTDSSGTIRAYVPAEPLERFAGFLQDGAAVTVRGTVRQRDGRKVCDVLEIEDSEGGIGLGQTATDESSTGDT